MTFCSENYGGAYTVYKKGAFIRDNTVTLELHRDPIKMHPFCLGLYFRNWSIKMKNYFIITISRVLSFIGKILSKIRWGVLEKSRILYWESILLHSNGIYYSNSHVHLLKRIRPQHCLNNGKNKFYSWMKLFSGKQLQNNKQRKHFGFD